MKISHPGWYSSCLWLWCFSWSYSIDVWPLLLCWMHCSCSWYHEGQQSTWVWDHDSQFHWHKGMFCLSTSWRLLFIIFEELPFNFSSLSSEFWQKEYDFLWLCQDNLTKQNQINILIDVFESNVPLFSIQGVPKLWRRRKVLLWVEELSLLDMSFCWCCHWQSHFNQGNTWPRIFYLCQDVLSLGQCYLQY